MEIISFSDLHKINMGFDSIVCRHCLPSWKSEIVENLIYNVGYSNLGKRKYLHNFHFCLNGNAKITFNNKTIYVKKGDLYYIPPYVDRIIYSESIEFEYYRLSFSALNLATNEFVSFSDTPLILCKDIPKNIKQYFFDLSQITSRQGSLFAFKAGAMINNFMFDLIILLNLYQVTSYSNYSKVHAAITYIQDNLTSNLTNSELAALCNLSEPYFRKCFKQATNFSPVEYKNYVRIKRACECLKNGDGSIDRVATISGFMNVGYFCETFKKIMGVTPSYYRKHM